MSQKSDYKHKIGVVIVNGNNILGVGFNKASKTHPRSSHPFHTIHGELDAVLSANRTIENSDVYIYRELKDGQLALSRPCIYCEELLRAYKIKKVHYTDNNSYKTLTLK